MAGANSTVQLTVPDELRGRVMALHTLMFAGITPFGAFVMGSVAQAGGVQTALVVSGGGGLIAVLALLVWWVVRPRGRSLQARAEGEAVWQTFASGQRGGTTPRWRGPSIRAMLSRRACWRDT